MTFLQPWLLLALPLLLIPIIIHLLHLRRYQTVPWAAMQFLLNATKMSSGYSKLRQWLVLAARATAIAALIFLVSRPLTSGITGWLATDRNELTILVLDRSPSMQQRQGGQGLSKLQIALQRFEELASVGGVRSVLVQTMGFESGMEFESVASLSSDPRLVGSSLTTDIPMLLEQSKNAIELAGVSKATVWVASDLRESDWKSTSGDWGRIRSAFAKLPTEVQFQLLDLKLSEPNRSIQVTSAKQVQNAEGTALLLSLRLSERDGVADNSEPVEVPVEIQIGEATSLVPVPLQGGAGELKDYRIPLDRLEETGMGWGSVRVPADANPADNVAYFAFEPTQPRRTLLVSEDSKSTEAMKISASISADPDIPCEVIEIEAKQLADIDWKGIVTVIWHHPLPTAEEAIALNAFVARGGQLLFVPSDVPGAETAYGIKWDDWQDVAPKSSPETNDGIAPQSEESSEGALANRVEQWRNDSLLLANTLNGTSLPLSEVEIYRVCRMEYQGTELATLQGGVPWLARLEAVQDTDRGSIYALATTTAERDSNLARNGIAIYIMLQRLIEAGAKWMDQESIRIVQANQVVRMQSAELLLGDNTVLSSRYGEHAGVYRLDRAVFAQNRAIAEDETAVVSENALKTAFGELVWFRTDAIATDSGLIQEIWRWFAILVLIALFVESIFSMPKSKKNLIAT